MTPKPALILIVLAHLLGVVVVEAGTENMIGSWKVEIAFANGENRSFRFDAREAGKGSFALIDPMAKVWSGAERSEGKWSRDDQGSVTFLGSVEFPLGNVGLDAGALVLKGKFNPEGTITGSAVFFRLDQDPKSPDAKPSKNGSFKAMRATDG